MLQVGVLAPDVSQLEGDGICAIESYTKTLKYGKYRQSNDKRKEGGTVEGKIRQC